MSVSVPAKAVRGGQRVTGVVALGLCILGAPRSKAADGGQTNESSTQAIAVASKWFDAFSRGDVDSLKKQSHFPFALRTSAESECKSEKASGPATLAGTLKCLYKTDILAEDLKDKDTRTSPWAIASKEALPRWARRWAKTISGQKVPVTISVYGNGTFHELVLIVTPDGVEELWKNTTFDSE